MLLIGEVSKISQVSLRMLRYYDKNNIFKPSIINEENGYRYYSADQLDDLYRIVELRDLGFNVSQIGELIKEGNKEKYLQAIRDRKRELEEEVCNINQRLKRIEALENDITAKSDNEPDTNITIVLKSIPAQDVISYRRVVPNYFCEGEMWEDFGKKLIPSGISFSNESFSLYHDTDYREEDVDIELCVVTEGTIDILPEGLVHRQVIGCEKAVSILVKGPYENISIAYRKFAHWLEKHKEYKMEGPTRQICYVSPINSDNPEEYLTEILIPLSD